MTEATVGDGAPSVNGNQAFPAQLRGLQRGLYCKVSDLRKYMKWSWKVWKSWTKDGLETDKPDEKTEYVMTDWVIDFLRTRAAKKKGQ